MSRHRHHDLEPIAACDLADVSGGAGMIDMMLPLIIMMKKKAAPPAAPPPQQQPQQPALPPLPVGAERTVYYSDGTTRSG